MGVQKGFRNAKCSDSDWNCYLVVTIEDCESVPPVNSSFSRLTAIFVSYRAAYAHSAVSGGQNALQCSEIHRLKMHFAALGNKNGSRPSENDE
jgi:hypothetical protein